VRQEVQEYLVKALALARASKERLSEEQTERKLASFSGGLEALRYVGELSVGEESDWADRMRLALGMPIETPRLAITFDPAAEHGKDIKRFPDVDPTRLGRFLRSLPVPDVEHERYGAVLRVTKADVYEMMVYIHWRLAPEPDLAAAFPEETAQLEHDIEGLDAWEAQRLRRHAEGRMRGMRLYTFCLADDVETEYRCIRGGAHGHGGEMTGEAGFSPAPPLTASMLRFTWLDVNIDIPLS
jgi:hypothetical protein